ncbi:hypothetical protein BJ912DRAFT_860601 [Pholiota molesta]|nr:hypothetical protein BJ912DRAFT_860601 [Pholiota molesta]
MAFFFNLDFSGVAGLLGGEEWFAANSAKLLMRHGRWTGWYNSPGSYYVGRKYGSLVQAPQRPRSGRSFRIESARMLQLDSMEGPRFMEVQSRYSQNRTGHVAHLIACYCDQIGSPDKGREYRNGTATSVTILDLGNVVKWRGYPNVPEEFLISLGSLAFGALSSASCMTIGFCAWPIIDSRDWFSFAAIFLGAISNGVSSYVFGSGILTLPIEIGPQFSEAHGILMSESQRNIIVLKGSGNNVSNIIRGKFDVVYPGTPIDNFMIWCCLFILNSQFLLQLFLIPQASYVGQLAFLCTFFFSWIFNAILAWYDRNYIQTQVLFKTLGMWPEPKWKKLHFQTPSEASAFVAFYTHPNTLTELVPDQTDAWMAWKDLITTAWSKNWDPAFVLNSRQFKKRFDSLDAQGQQVIRDLTEITTAAYERAKSLKAEDKAKKAEENTIRDDNATVLAPTRSSVGSSLPDHHHRRGHNE